MIVLGGCPTDPPIEETASTTIVSSNPTSSSSVPTGPTDSDVDTTVGIPTTSTGGSTDTTGDVPPEVCFDPPPPPAPTPVPMFDNVSLDEQFVILDADIEPFDRCPETVTRFPAVLDDVEMEVIIYRPAEGDREMSWPDGTFNFIPFTHGNGQDGQYYPALHTYLAQRGFVVASITNDGDADPIVRTPRLLCMTEALLDGTVEWTGSGKLNGRFALTGHSTGGLGAFLAAKAIRGAAVDVVDTDQCDEVVGELPVVSLIVSDGVNPDVIVDLSPFGRQALPEARLESVCTGLPSLGCAALENMQTTFRINLQDLCVMSDSLSLSNVKRLGIRFDGPGGILFLDDFDIRTVPGEPDVACRCEQ